MIEPNIYCKVCGITMQCIADFQKEFGKLPIVLEIGCADGQGTMRYAGFTQATICVDPMVSGRPDIVSLALEDMPEDKEKIDLFHRRNQDFPVQLVIGASLWKESFAAVTRILDGHKVDILIVDGCHHPFEAVWGDFALYYPLVSKNGYVVFDDLYEDCILEAYEKAALDHNMIKHDRWSINTPHILQDAASLKKTED
jgi:cephalosporin hydroxylase